MRSYHSLLIFVIILFLGCTKDSDSDTDSNPTPEVPTNYSLTVTSSPSEGGSVSPSNGTFEEGTVVTIEGTPSNGYLFKEWSGDVQGTDDRISVTMNSNKSITGTFEKTPEFSYKEFIINLRNRVIEIIRSDGDPSWSYSFDLESDGDLDVILIRSGPSGSPKKEMILFKNEDNQGFEEIPTGIDCWGRTVVFDDFNGDGLIDFFVPELGPDYPPFPGELDQMIYQTPDGGLEEVTDQVLPPLMGFSHGGTSLDIDNDGDRDIIVNTGGSQEVLRNENGVWNYWENGIQPVLESDKHDVGGHPTIDGELRLDIYDFFISCWWSGSGDFNNDGYEDVIIGGGFNDLSEPPDQNNVNFRTVDMYNNVLEKGDLVLLQDPSTGSLVYNYPESLIPNSWRDSGIKGVTIGILILDYNNDGCDDFIGYSNSNPLHKIEFKVGDCYGGFTTTNIVEVFSPSTGDTLWEDFELVDIDNDGDKDIVISNSIQWYDTHLIPEEHIVFINENGQFNQRNGVPEDLINLPPHFGISWYLDGE